MTVSTRTLIEAGLRRGIEITVLSASKNTYLVRLHGKEHLWKSTSFGGSISSSRISNDKALTHKLLHYWEYLVPDARVFPAKARDEALAWADGKTSVVFKPVDGAHGFGITVLPQGALEMAEAWDRVIEVSGKPSQVQIEEYIAGEDYRFLVVGETCIYVIHRLPAAVQGDGKLSIKHLIDRENTRPARGKIRYASFYSPIEFDLQLSENLAREGYTLDSIPPKGERIVLRRVCNAGKGGTDKDVTDIVPQAMKDEAVALAKRLEMDVLAIDVRCPDILKASSLHKDMHILELNATPGITLAMANWVADAVWDALIKRYDPRG